MTKQLAFMSAADLRIMVLKKEISPQELALYFKKRLEKFIDLGSTLQIYENFNFPKIKKQNNHDSLLFGVPGLRKDNICHVGRITSCASKILANYKSPYSATVIERIEEEGAIILGSCNMDEFGMGSSGENSAFFKAKNPWDQTRVPGGSSGGSAVAVSAGLVPWSLGTDTGGSVRQPAAFNGIVGLKPTYGSISRYGLIAHSSSLDHIGIFTRTVLDNSLVYRIIAGHDFNDPTSLAIPVDNSDITKLPQNLTLGYIDIDLYSELVDPEIQKAFEAMLKVYENLGVKLKKIKLASLDYSLAAYLVITRAEAASNLARFDGVRYGLRINENSLDKMYSQTRHEGFGQEVRLRIITGNYFISSIHNNEFYRNAKNVQLFIKNEIKELLNTVDAFLLPVHAGTAFKFGTFAENSFQMDLQIYFNCFVNLAGVPSLALPCGISSDNLPIGFQIVSTHGEENLLFRLGHAYEKETPWHLMHPPGFED